MTTLVDTIREHTEQLLKRDPRFSVHKWEGRSLKARIWFTKPKDDNKLPPVLFTTKYDFIWDSEYVNPDDYLPLCEYSKKALDEIADHLPPDTKLGAEVWANAVYEPQTRVFLGELKLTAWVLRAPGE